MKLNEAVINTANAAIDEILRVRQEAQMEKMFSIMDVIIREVKETVIATPFSEEVTALIGEDEFDNKDLYDEAIVLFTETRTVELEKATVVITQDGENVCAKVKFNK